MSNLDSGDRTIEPHVCRPPRQNRFEASSPGNDAICASDTEASGRRLNQRNCGPEENESIFLQDLVRFIGPNAASYLRQARLLASGQAGGKYTLPRDALSCWHWPAFLATVPWLFYRKMYTGGIILVSAPVLLNLVVPGGLFLGWALLIALVAGLFARRWYLDHARRRILEARRYFPEGPHHIDLLRRAGGVSVPGAVLGSAIEIATVASTLSGLLNGSSG